MTPDTRRARLEELLATEATQSLTAAESRELDALLAEYPDQDPTELELAAAAVHLALCGQPQAMPTALVERLHMAAVAIAPARTSPAASAPAAKPGGRTILAWAGWIVAASLAAVLLWTQWPRPERTLEQQRAEFVQKSQPPAFVGEKESVSGTIVWSDKDQLGYLEVKGLAPIDQAAGTYQLWIVDGERKDSAPVDGGVFHVRPDGTALIRIKPPIQVKKAVAFAITREKEPGGVVVSKVPPDQYELVLIQKG